ncbi:MAG: hypothetical protein RLZZ565_692 [Planctomycetota bacterium]
MATLPRRLIAALELARLPVAFGAVANVWLMVFLASHARGGPSPSPGLLAAAAGVAVGFLAFGAILNDFLDAKHDRAFAPDRPIPSGAVRPRRAVQLAIASLLVGVGSAATFGTGGLAAALAMAVLILVYDAFAKHVPALGIVVSGLVTAASMLVADPSIPIAAPICLAMSQTMAIGIAAYILAGKRPRLTMRAIFLGIAGWAFWNAAIVAAAQWHHGESAFLGTIPARAALVPLATTILGGLAAGWKLRRARGASAGARVLRYGSLWKALVAASWLWAAGLEPAALWVGAAAVVIFALVALLKEIGAQLAAPAEWRS